jgi:hypothetical protein
MKKGRLTRLHHPLPHGRGSVKGRVRRLLFSFLFLISKSPLHAAFLDKPPSARAAALGESLSADAGLDALAVNPAGLAELPRWSLSLYRTNLLGLSALPYQTFSLGHRTRRRGGWALGVTQLDHALYQEQEIKLGAGFRCDERWRFGAAVSSSRVSVKRYGQDQAYSVDIGLLAVLTPAIEWGASWRRATQPALGKFGESLPSSVRSGAALRFLSAGTILVDGVVDLTNARYSWQAGLEWTLSRRAALRAGLSPVDHRPSFGLGFSAGFLRLDYAVTGAASAFPEQHMGLVLQWK